MINFENDGTQNKNIIADNHFKVLYCEEKVLPGICKREVSKKIISADLCRKDARTE